MVLDSVTEEYKTSNDGIDKIRYLVLKIFKNKKRKWANMILINSVWKKSI